MSRGPGRPKKALRWTLHWASQEFTCDPKVLGRLLSQAGITEASDGKFSTKDIIQALFGDIHSEKLQKVRAERELLELKLSTERGTLVSADESARFWSEKIMAMRAVILRSGLSDHEKDELFEQMREAK